MVYSRLVRFCTALALAIVFSGCTTSSKTPTAAVPQLQIDGELPSVAATYITTRIKTPVVGETHSHDHSESTPREWRFFREQNTIEVEDISSQSGELWQRDGTTQFFLKLFHADRRGIEYRMDDLAILEISPSWQQHSLLLPPQIFQQLKEVETGWRQGYPYRRYLGKSGADQFEVIWRLDINLPALIVRTEAGHVERTELQAAFPIAQSPWQRQARETYDVIDFADLGDRESDPFVVKVQHQLPGGHPHSH